MYRNLEFDETYLTEKLMALTAHIKPRENAAALILEQPALFLPLLQHCFSSNEKLSPKACWVLEFVCKENLILLLPHQAYFSSRLSSLKNDSALRPVAKICEMICTEYYINRSPDFRERVTADTLNSISETLFDWMIRDVKVATKAYSMQSLFLLSEDYRWIAPELKLLLEADIPKHSAAYKARARHLLRKLSD